MVGLQLEWMFGMAERHPESRDWRRFLWGECASEVAAAMARHLEECRECMAAFLAEPAPPPTALGRPLPMGWIGDLTPQRTSPSACSLG